ncbi:MAG TPA: hypothetical protein VNF46_02705 [Gammaproteobacteria bacterium]|nr:hypothetical protein [Gammaproteobacteria bacterium]
MQTNNSIKTLSLISLSVMLGLGSGMSAHAFNPPAETSTTNPSTASVDKTQTTNLGKINVTAEKELIKTLQAVRWLSTNPFHPAAATPM